MSDLIKITEVRSEQIDIDLANAITHLTSILREVETLVTAADLHKIVASHRLFVAIDTGELNSIVGMACLIQMALPQGERFLIESVAVLPNYRGQGIGQSLIQHIVKEAKLMGANQVRLTCNTRRNDARRMYDNLGFRKVSTDVMSFEV